MFCFEGSLLVWLICFVFNPCFHGFPCYGLLESLAFVLCFCLFVYLFFFILFPFFLIAGVWLFSLDWVFGLSIGFWVCFLGFLLFSLVLNCLFWPYFLRSFGFSLFSLVSLSFLLLFLVFCFILVSFWLLLVRYFASLFSCIFVFCQAFYGFSIVCLALTLLFVVLFPWLVSPFYGFGLGFVDVLGSCALSRALLFCISSIHDVLGRLFLCDWGSSVSLAVLLVFQLV